jgi:Transposase, Mutator family
MKQSTQTKPRVLNKTQAKRQAQPLLKANPEAVLPMLEMMESARLSLDDLLGDLSRGFIEELLMLSASTVAGDKHPGRREGEVRWHGQQGGVVKVGQAKLRVQRPRLRDASGEVPIPAYAALQADEALSRRVGDILACNVSTRKYARVVHRCTEEMGISKSAVSRQFVKQSAKSLAKLMDHDFAQRSTWTPSSLPSTTSLRRWVWTPQGTSMCWVWCLAAARTPRWPRTC